MAVGAMSATYDVSTLPNVQKADHTKHLVNPDGIISPSVQAQIDTLLLDARRISTSEVVAVIVDDIDAPDIDIFATELFNSWGIGKNDNNNGILILVAKDWRKAVIRTGPGAEGILPDITAGRILRNEMFPRFKKGDYEGGMLAAVRSIHDIVVNPDAVAELHSDRADNYGDNSDYDGFRIYIIAVCILAAVMSGLLLYRLYKVRDKSDYEKYTALESLRPAYLCLTFIGLFIPVIASLPLVLLLYSWRNRPKKCGNCGTGMRKIDEVHDNDFLTPAQDLEEQLNSVDYDVWQCPACGEVDTYPFVVKGSLYKPCPNCHTRAYRLVKTRQLVAPTATSTGILQKEYRCLNCNYTHFEQEKIPARPLPVVIVPGGGGHRGGGGFSGGSFGGGFGGGFTGGGGASGGW